MKSWNASRRCDERRLRRLGGVPGLGALAAIGIVLASLTSGPAWAAKAPNAEERSIALSGPAAAALGDLFGMPSSKGGSVLLPLSEPMSWAVYLLKLDTKVRLYNSDGMPPRFDTLEYSSDPAPTIRISPFWLDENTSLPNPEPIHLVGSPFVARELPGSDPWTALVRRLQREPEWRDSGRNTYERCFESEGDVRMCLYVQHADDYPDNRKVEGYRAILTARLPTP